MTTVLAPPDAGTRVAPHRPATDVPRLLQWVSLGVVVAGVTMGLVGALRTGTSWDEPFHVMRLRNYLDHQMFGLDWSGNPDDPGSNTLVYGPVAMLLLHGLGALVGVEHWNTVSTSPAAYEVRHVGVALIGLACTAAAAGISRIILGSWRWGLVTAAVLLALPMWTGHLMFNIKDVPVATGYTLITLALVAMDRAAGRPGLRIAGLVAGIVLMVGTRPAMFSAVLVALVVLAVTKGRSALPEAAAGVLGAGLLLVLAYPTVFSDPTNLLHSAEKSSNFRDGDDAVLGYVPFHVLAQVPLLLLAFLAVGLVAVVRGRSGASHALVLAQLLALPVVAILRHSDLYNGLRQLLFAAPAWAVVVTIGLAHAVAWARENNRVRAVGAVAAAALVLPVLDQVTLFPYQYTYYNVALDATGVHVPSDYWRVSIRELLPLLPTDGQIVCSPTRTESGRTAFRFAQDTSADCRTDELGPLASRWSAERLPTVDLLPHEQFYVIIDRGHPTPENCTRLATVDRVRHLRRLSMTYVARCTQAPPVIGTAPVVFDRDAEEAEDALAPEAWSYAPEGWVARGTATAITAPGASAVLSFAAPRSCQAGACVVVLGADSPSDLTASVNGLPPARVEHSPTGTVRISLPARTRTAWITFARTSGEPLGLQVHQLRVIAQKN
ncbi:MAG: hypothetical protein ACJ72O_00845 [Marmoricola sp.]